MTEETDKIRSVVMEVLWSPLETVTATADAIMAAIAKAGYAIVSEREWEAEGMSRRTWYRREAEKK